MIMVYRWIKKLQFWLLPPTCLLCGAPGESERDLCAGCHADLPLNSQACQQCGIPLRYASTELICGECQQQPPAFDRTFAPLLYQPPVDYLIKGLKFSGRLAAARLLGEWLGDALQQRVGNLPEYLIPVPLHPSRLRERGFNQSLELARPVARRLGIPLLPQGVRRIRHTQPQTQLAAEARRSNVQGAFAVSRLLQARHVAILDDVITTGSTVNEIARVLRAAGVEEIEVWACARTSPNR
jgi:ComF family protein